MPVFGQILGIEGTAWNLSAALFDRDLITLASRPYSPAQGGIHPREAAQHHASVMKEVLGEVLGNPHKITGIAYSQGPGLGPCLRTVATAARSLALALDVPLVGVNHCVAHIEIGCFATGCRDPVVLYASGANTQVIGYLNGRYRVFGETLDIGIGNALDKFARSKDLPHPGGPHLERLAKQGKYTELPYTVKGMDLAFSGLVSAAKESRAHLQDVCYSLQETAFAMCVEVTERALSLSGKNEVLLVGGVGANRRLQEMLRTMCEDRGALFFVPEQKYLGDNGAMIAYTGKLMLDTGARLSVETSQINPSFRSDEVEVTWKHETQQNDVRRQAHDDARYWRRGAEAVITITGNTAGKRRIPKRYRVPDLDRKLIAERTRAEARTIAAARRAGVPTPVMSDITTDTICMEYVGGTLLTDNLSETTVREVGITVGKLHTAGIMHGDLTTSNLILRKKDKRCVLIDFGLAQVTEEIEQQGVDIHVFFQTLESTAPDRAESLKAAFVEGYKETFHDAEAVLHREYEIRQRGRYL
ncbi:MULTISPECIES: bifunctional N(6)-L-threonylcarbamoyladenine synthase/serine/threonine protein kinase [unclassified Methanoregula]|uniref:bifunctional N(6)-L-threonylcarbamoyladenine synthase/serine/threonine protein kinase n=1 Tax=unclassified Methanoregula TaxID=2649730 RepID=UPI0009CEAB22|nr:MULTISPECIES: bifunctional N(6)-L-threonylcarbamoyladenine synthase/serine/threonine protein kinase [unclassified Methanoregula]OPX61716.1 MAG: putative bifunctional tRNA threonylcarbamoyladenosine biosynthesis protein [Methanoregula sp. PtaB.Bin085]OPY33975.1 MAG: putative bifunctional tRNA threonylcarbamoyladenosine biosynthesis protein [Methanoregula sp. PtaU1.Bin006]